MILPGGRPAPAELGTNRIQSLPLPHFGPPEFVVGACVDAPLAAVWKPRPSDWVSLESAATADSPCSILRPKIAQTACFRRSPECSGVDRASSAILAAVPVLFARLDTPIDRSEEHTSELQSLMRISYSV